MKIQQAIHPALYGIQTMVKEEKRWKDLVKKGEPPR